MRLRSVAIPVHYRERAKALVDPMAKGSPDLAALVRLSSAGVLRIALEIGLQELEKQYLGKEPASVFPFNRISER